MKTRYYALAALASLAFASCAPVYDTDNLPIIPEPEPEIVYEGSGTLYYGDPASAKATNSTYSWKADGDVISINVTVDTDEYAETGGYEIGHFNLDAASIGDFLGISVSDINDDIFTAIQPDGSATAWTSYAPGMWVNPAGEGCGWSDGSLYWQWYIYSSTSYDYEYASNKGMLIIGGNPSNTPKCAGQTIVSKAKLTLGDRTVDFIITVKFEGEEYVAPTEPEAKMDYLTAGNGYAYQAAASGDHQYMWVMSEEGITVNVDAYVPAIEDWGYLMIGIDPEAMTDYLGIDDINKLADFEYFYPLDAEGNPGEGWTSYAPGQWFDVDGNPSNWADGAAFWQYQFGENKYEGHYTEGLLVIGTNPGNAEALVGKTVSQTNVIGDKTFTVNVTYHAEYPTALAGTIGANSYSWELTDEAMNINASISLANLDDSWGLLGFPINAKYVNEYYDINMDELTIDDFYPVDAEGNPGEKWTSYAPGQWFKADGSAGAWDTGIAFWQWYNASTYDFDLPNLVYLGKNPDVAAAEYEIGASYVSKAKLAGRDFIVTINVVE